MSQIDHLVLTTRSIKQCREFYSKVLGMKVETFTEGRQALLFGQRKSIYMNRPLN
ncbi:VOC family protein [Tatumella sp. OPLPL6]|uniref:VOC family protein n=1 Tax=Tatumella sp. OPLPL6 TaxID=1928657 RepID=UPI00336A276E